MAPKRKVRKPLRNYNNKLKAHKVKYDKVAALDMLEADYFNEIGKGFDMFSWEL